MVLSFRLSGLFFNLRKYFVFGEIKVFRLIFLGNCLFWIFFVFLIRKENGVLRLMICSKNVWVYFFVFIFRVGLV